MRDRGDIGVVLCEAGRPFGEQVLESLAGQFEKHSVREPIDPWKALRSVSRSPSHAFGNLVRRAITPAGPRNSFRLIESKEKHFGNSEIKTEIGESVRGMDVYVIQDVANTHLPYSVDENFRALKTAADACRRADARFVTAILPYFPYARQDRAIGRECWTAAQVARELEATGIDRVVTLDIHNAAIGGFFKKVKFENLLARRTLLEYIQSNINMKNCVLAAPDLGAMKRNEEYAQLLKKRLVGLYKNKDYSTGEVDEVKILGDVSGMDVLFVDDMIDRATTVVKVARAVKEAGAGKVYFFTSLPVFSDPAMERLTKLYNEEILTKVIGTNAIYHGPDFVSKTPWFEEASVSGYHAKVIFNLNHQKSISRLLE